MAKEKLVDSTGAVVAEVGESAGVPTPAPEPPYAHWVGTADSFIGGIPARDLSRAEWDALPDVLREAALHTQLYVIA